MVFLAAGSYAQKQGSDMVPFTTKSSILLPDLPVNSEANANYSSDLNSLGARGYKHFAKSFTNAEDVRIAKQGNSSFVYCRINGVDNRMKYDKRGNLNYVIRYYEESLLPRDVRHIVKSTFYDYSITGVTEVNIDDKTAFLVNIKNGITWKKIKVLDGEMSIEQEYTEK
jgi:hypothetical protein